MARIAGVDIPREKRVEVALTYIFGIGQTTSKQIAGGDAGQPGYAGQRPDRRRGRAPA